jgi:hypothetical protein
LIDWLAPYQVIEWGVHILMDRYAFSLVSPFKYFSATDNAFKTTGKTLSDAYVEMVSDSHAIQAVSGRHRQHLKGRIISVRKSCHDELMRRLFPTWGGMRSDTTDQRLKKLYLSRPEIDAILTVCKDYKVHSAHIMNIAH